MYVCVCWEGGAGERGDGGGWGGSGWFTQTELELDKLTVLLVRLLTAMWM